MINDGSGNSTQIVQSSKVSKSDLAARIAAGKIKIEQQRRAIYDFEMKRYEKQTISGFQSKLGNMKNMLGKMEMELGRMEQEFMEK